MGNEGSFCSGILAYLSSENRKCFCKRSCFIISPFLERHVRTFRFEYKNEIEYENNFSNLDRVFWGAFRSPELAGPASL